MIARGDVSLTSGCVRQKKRRIKGQGGRAVDFINSTRSLPWCKGGEGGVCDGVQLLTGLSLPSVKACRG